MLSSHIQSVPPKWGHIRTQFSIFLNHIFQKVRPVPISFWNLTHFFDIHLKNTSNLIFPDFKVSSKSFFPKDFKIGLTF